MSALGSELSFAASGLNDCFADNTAVGFLDISPKFPIDRRLRHGLETLGTGVASE